MNTSTETIWPNVKNKLRQLSHYLQKTTRMLCLGIWSGTLPLKRYDPRWRWSYSNFPTIYKKLHVCCALAYEVEPLHRNVTIQRKDGVTLPLFTENYTCVVSWHMKLNTSTETIRSSVKMELLHERGSYSNFATIYRKLHVRCALAYEVEHLHWLNDTIQREERITPTFPFLTRVLEAWYKKSNTSNKMMRSNVKNYIIVVKPH